MWQTRLKYNSRRVYRTERGVKISLMRQNIDELCAKIAAAGNAISMRHDAHLRHAYTSSVVTPPTSAAAGRNA